MNRYRSIILAILSSLMVSCSAIKIPVSNQYILDNYSHQQLSSRASKLSILVTSPDAVAGYQTEQMLYVDKTYALTPFTKNAWVSPPADMLFPLMILSLQRSGYFYAVTSGANSELTDYRIDTQLIELHQSFLSKPSQIQLVVKVVLSKTKDNRTIASRVITRHVPCPTENPYGGVIAANRAVEAFTADMTNFVISHVRKDSLH